jgi:hypothetical protein
MATGARGAGMTNIFNQAADLIEARGWARGNYEDKNGCLCATGALGIVVYGNQRWGGITQSVEQLHAIIQEQTKNISDFVAFLIAKYPHTLIPIGDMKRRLTPTGYFFENIRRIVIWNDTKGNSKEEVVSILREFASSRWDECLVP